MKQKNKTIEKLKLYYALAFILGALTIAPTHIFPEPYFMYARFPHFLEQMSPIFGIGWPMTFEIYHYCLYVLGPIIALNALGILIYPKFKKLFSIISFFGTILLFLVVIFLFFKFTTVNLSTAIILGTYSIVLLFITYKTFKFVVK